MYLLKIAFRNLFRRKGRTILISLMLASAVAVFLLLDAFMIGMLDVSFRNVIDFQTPHLEIGRAAFFDSKNKPGDMYPITETFIPDDEIISAVKSIQGFEGLTMVLDFTANFVGARDDYPVIVRAIDSYSFSNVFKTNDYIIEGNVLDKNSTGILIGNQLAELFQLNINDYYTLLFRDIRESFSTVDGDITGIFATPHPDINQNYVFVNKDYAITNLGLNPNTVSQIMVRLSSRNLAEQNAVYLQKKLLSFGYDDLEVRSFRDASPILTSIEIWGYLETYFILALILIVGAIGIFNVVILSAIERIEEIGMMKAMGMKQFEIVLVFFFEAGGIGVIGSIIGCLVSSLPIAYLNIVGIELAKLYGGAELAMGIPVIGNIYASWNITAFILIFIFVVLVSMISSIIPSYWAAKKDPVEAIYHR